MILKSTQKHVRVFKSNQQRLEVLKKAKKWYLKVLKCNQKYTILLKKYTCRLQKRFVDSGKKLLICMIVGHAGTNKCTFSSCDEHYLLFLCSCVCPQTAGHSTYITVFVDPLYRFFRCHWLYLSPVFKSV